MVKYACTDSAQPFCFVIDNLIKMANLLQTKSEDLGEFKFEFYANAVESESQDGKFPVCCHGDFNKHQP